MGLAVAQSGKYVSERHWEASTSGEKMTAGDAAKILKKEKMQVAAKELVAIYRFYKGREPEWHHAGFYKGSNSRSTMGRTFFFTHEELEWLMTVIPQYQEDLTAKQKAEAEERERLRQEIVQGVYYTWESYSGKKKAKKLRLYKGSKLYAPSEFIELSDAGYAKAQTMEGKWYTGWDKPSRWDFE